MISTNLKLARLDVMAATLVTCTLLALLPVSASAAPSVLQDCASSVTALTHNYTLAQLQQALKSIPAQVAEYSNCEEMIEGQINAQLLRPIKLEKVRGDHQVPSAGNNLLPVAIVVIAVLVFAAGGYFYSRRRATRT